MHTKGPWRIEGSVIRASDSGRGLMRIPIGIVDDAPWPGLPTPEERKANANLIASAPDLLEALEFIINSLSDYDDEGVLDHVEPIIIARAAIAKAKGEQ